MRGEIKEKIEAKRQEIKAESERLRMEATQNHICANCGSPLPSGKRTYCSDTCSMGAENAGSYGTSRISCSLLTLHHFHLGQRNFYPFHRQNPIELVAIDDLIVV